MRVAVLLSSFQGEKYIGQQIESILPQLPADGRLIIRDDGSTDGTVQRVTAFDDPRISLIRGENRGFVRSFFTLMEQAPADADIVMLCDQDDVWLPNKISRAIAHLKDFGAAPALYCSRLQLVDVDLKPIGYSPDWPRAPSFSNALAENIVTGCTAALNRAALELVIKHGDARKIYFHDWWLYLVISAFGTVVFDRQPTILYRQHGGNAIGMGAGVERYRAIWRFLRKQSWVNIMFNQIREFQTTHAAALTGENRDLFKHSFQPESKSATARLLLFPARYRQFAHDELLLRLMVIANLLTKGRLTSS